MIDSFNHEDHENDGYEGVEFEDLEPDDLVDIAYDLQDRNNILFKEVLFHKEVVAQNLDLLQYKNRTLKLLKKDLDELYQKDKIEGENELERLQESHEIVKKFLDNYNLSADFEEYITGSLYDKKKNTDDSDK